ncbi:MAG: hypothetical protein ACFFE4_01565 [Candidatus Thorarchaeota archaeon]
MSTYYSSKIGYLIEDFMAENYNFQEVLKELREQLEDKWDRLDYLTMRLSIQSPDEDMVMRYYEEGAIKSHEYDATMEKVSDSVKSAILILTGKIAFTTSYYSPLRDAITIQHSEEYAQALESRHAQRTDIIVMEFYIPDLEPRDVMAFIRMWNLAELSFANRVQMEVHFREHDTLTNELLFQKELEKIKIGELQDFLRVDDSKLLQHPNYHRILKTYIFPEGFHSAAEITLDIAQEEMVPKKRRMVSLNGTKAKFHEILTPHTSYDTYKDIIQDNDISGIYLSVRGANEELMYMLIDIDVSSLFYGMFSRQVVWELIINIISALQKTVSSFGLPPFKVSFSGTKGVHLLYAVAPNTIVDFERQVNLPELSTYGIPGIRVVKKEKVSSINDIFKFTKTLLQSNLLYTVYQGGIVIPKEIRDKLQIFYPYQLFRLSPDSKNLVSILLDCSSQAKGVFRLFSPHPGSRLVSIPISDSTTNTILDRYRIYQNVIEDAKLSNVLKKFDEDDISLYLQRT